jgi:carboxylesterase
VIHGRLDHTVPMEDSLELTGSLGSDLIERLWLDRSFHIVTLDVEKALVVSAVQAFLTAHIGAHGRPAPAPGVDVKMRPS